MATKRPAVTTAVAATSPGTGLFPQEPRVSQKNGDGRRGGGSYARAAQDAAMVKQTKMAQEEEGRVNSQLVEILERKCGKLRQRAEEEGERRQAADAQLSANASELEELRRRLSERDAQLTEFLSAQRDLAEGRREVGASLQDAERGRQEAERALHQCRMEAERQREEAARTETEWKDQIIKLVASDQSARRRIAELEQEVSGLKAENTKMTETGHDLVRRYEEECKQRFEFEERCLALQEKLHGREQKNDAAQQRGQQDLQARRRAEELLRHHKEKEQQASQKANELEQRCKSLQGEVQRLRSDLRACHGSVAPGAAPGLQLRREGSHQDSIGGESVEPLGGLRAAPHLAPRPSETFAAKQLMDAQTAEEQPPPFNPPPSQLPVPSRRRPNSASRPATATSAASASRPATATSAASASQPGIGASAPGSVVSGCSTGSSVRGNVAPGGRSQSGVVRASSVAPATTRRSPSNLPPGAIRRAGSTPVRAGALPRGSSVGSTLVVARAGDLAPATKASKPPSEIGDLHIDDTIPSEPDDSSDEEVLAPVRTVGARVT